MFLFTYTAAVLSLLFLGSAVFLLKTKRDQPLAVFLALHMIADAIWIGSNAGADLSKTEPSLIFFSGMAVIGASFFITFYLCFIHFFVHTRIRAWIIGIYALPSIVLSSLAFSSFSVAETFFPQGMPAQIIPGPLYTYYLAFLFGGLLYGSIMLVSAWKRADEQKRKQIFYIGTGFLILFVGCGIFSVILPLLGELRFYSAGPQFSLFFIGFSVYAIFRYRLLDIRVAMQRSLIYSVLLALIVGLYLLLLSLLTAIFPSKGTTPYLLSSMMTTLIGIFSVPRIEQHFRRLTDRFFFKEPYEYGSALHRLSEIVSTSVHIQDIFRNTSIELQNIFRIDHAYFTLHPEEVIFDRKHQVRSFHNSEDRPSELALAQVQKHQDIIVCAELPSMLDNPSIDPDYKKALTELSYLAKRHDIGVMIPLMSDGQFVGGLSLTNKKSGDPYSNQDIELLKTFSHQASLAIKKAHLYDQVIDYSRNLEERVAERTERLEAMQRHQSQMMIDISHELQTPLTIIKGQIAELQRSVGETTSLSSFQTSVDRISSYIRRLLTLSKLETEQPAHDIIDLSQLTDETLEYISTLCEQREITLEQDIAKDIAIIGHRERLEEMITNIMSNAIKYIAEERRIHVRLEKKEETAVLTIADSGIGMKQEQIDNVFKRFYRLSDQKHDIEGTGLGLAITNQIVKNHNGSIRIDSEEGKGTTVVITLPCQST